MREDYEIINLTDENGEEQDYAIIETVEYEGKVYVALVRDDQLEDEECEFIILRIDEDPENPGEDMFNSITDEDEFNEVLEAIEEKLAEEYDFDDSADFGDEEEDQE